ncbi:MAG: DUF3613 domain-containing protein [Pigmentiphaga sp.]|uniref:DUF3613 domain-containing protein n=1 Tax=Pigmentiphaga sp. TaxID=1977564 RepID=UPI0029B5E60E|nr:DUF3613 domain-containing protein [Pigmentiphaga sp.]MDX3907744.1 DUF3613 domain-containing protein [Pigmentiphaga sp.]
MKPTSHIPHKASFPRRTRLPLLLAVLLGASLAHAQNNAPVTGSMLQETPEQRARMEAVRQAEAQERARRAAEREAAQRALEQRAAQERAAQQRAAGQAQQPAAPASAPRSSVVRQVPGSSGSTAAAAQPVPAARPQSVQSPDQRVTTVVAQPPAPQPARAQAQAPVVSAPVRQMAAPAVSSPRRRPAGAVTQDVLSMQREGRHAGQALPMLGATAVPSWQRYVESFSHPIPEFYETTSQPKQ